MNDFFIKSENFRYHTALSFLTIVLVFIIDLLTPLGYAVRVFYLIPIFMLPYKSLTKRDSVTAALATTVLLWFCYFHKSPGIATPEVVFINRSFMTLIIWIISYVQMQRAITYRKLLISEENLQLAQSIAQIGSYEADVNSGKMHWSKELFRIFERNLSEGDPSYDEFIEYIHPDDIESLSKLEQSGSAGKKHFKTEFRIITGSGKTKNITVSGITYTDRSDKSIKRIGTLMDITDKKRSDEALRLESSKLRAILDNSPVCISMKDKEGRMILANPAVYKSFDVPPEDKFIGGSIYDFFPKEVADELWHNDLQALNSENPFIAEEKIMNRDGKRHYYITAKFPVYYQDSKELIGIGAISTDITEQKRLEEGLQRSEERFRQTFEKSAIGIAYILPDGKWLKVNDAYCKMFGYTREELRNFTYKEITHRDDIEHDLQMREKLLSGEVDSFTLEKRYVRKDGTIKWAMLTCSLAFEESTGLKYMISVLEDITALKYLQKQIADQHQLLETVIAEIPSGILLLRGKDLKIELVNDAYKAIAPGKPMAGEKFENVWPEIYPELRELYMKTLDTGEPYSAVDAMYWIKRSHDASPEKSYFTFSLTRVHFPDTDEWGILNTTIETTESVLGKEALQKSESKLIETQKLAHVGSFDLDLLTGKPEWTEETYRIYELDPKKDLPSLHEITALFYPEDIPWIAEKIKEGMDNHTIISFDARLLLPGNKLKYIKYIARPVYNKEGKPVKRIGAIADITELKLQQVKLERTLRKLKRSKAQLLEAQKLARMGNYSIDFKNGGKMRWSDEMYNIWEIDRNAPLPSVEEVWKRVHPEDIEELKRVLYNQQPGGEKVETDFRILFPDNRVKYVHITTMVTFDENGNLIRRDGIEMDITERKLAQAELERTLHKLERSNQELQQFAYIASHDLQEPLRMVSSYLAVLEKKYGRELDIKAKEFIHFAIDGAKRMSRLIKDLLAYSRVTTQAKEFTDADLNKIFSDVTQDLQILIKEKGAKFSSTKLPVIKADPVQMHQLLQNIIGNAMKFHGESAPLINLRAKEIKNGWLFSIRDNGIGIDPQFYDRIFQVFQRLHEQGKYPGTGIGLALCKKIVERHGGRIWVESEVGKGTTFYFTIPERYTPAYPDERDNMEILSA